MKCLSGRNFTDCDQKGGGVNRSLSLLFYLSSLLLLNGCVTSYLDLPPQDKILKLQIENSAIKAESENYSYFFDLEDQENNKEYLQYQQFIKTYQNETEGYVILFNVDTGYVHTEVSANYNLILKPMPNRQLENLKSDYRVVTLKDSTNKNHITVQFQLKGVMFDLEKNKSYGHFSWKRVDDRYQLKTPILVNLNDKSKTLSNLSALFIAPFYPMIMMYGCATSQCI